MSHTVQHPAVVLRSNYQHLRALLAIAIAVILGLTVAVVVLATTSNHVTLASPITHSAQANPSAETGAKLDHSGRNATGTQTTSRLANYPDAPPPSATTPQQSVRYYLDAPHPGHR